MKNFEFSKIIFYFILVCGILTVFFGFGLYSGSKKTIVFRKIYIAKKQTEEAIKLVFNEAGTLTHIHPKHMLQPARSGGEGVTINNVKQNVDYIFLSGFFNENNELRLIRRNGEILNSWPVKFSEIFPHPTHLSDPPETDWNADIDGGLILPDGSVVFSFELCGLVKLDRCGKIVWTVNRLTHHSVEPAEAGGFWVCGRRYVTAESDATFPPFEPPYYEDTIMKISESGEIIEEFSAPEIFYLNNMQALLTASGHNYTTGMEWDHEIVHLNKIDELNSTIADKFPLFEAGDLALSFRNLNLVLVIDPVSRKVKWWHTGPWLRQHSSKFMPWGTIAVFNNNVFRTAFGYNSDDDCFACLSIPRVSNILEIDPVTGAYRVLFGSKDGQEMLSVIRGKHEATIAGGVFVTEFEAGRVFETDKNGKIIWEFINRYDEDEVGEITQARIYPISYFQIKHWNCR